MINDDVVHNELACEYVDDEIIVKLVPQNKYLLSATYEFKLLERAYNVYNYDSLSNVPIY